MIGSRFGAPVITSFLTVERSTYSGAVIWFSVGMGSPCRAMPGRWSFASDQLQFIDQPNGGGYDLLNLFGSG